MRRPALPFILAIASLTACSGSTEETTNETQDELRSRRSQGIQSLPDGKYVLTVVGDRAPTRASECRESIERAYVTKRGSRITIIPPFVTDNSPDAPPALDVATDGSFEGETIGSSTSHRVSGKLSYDGTALSLSGSIWMTAPWPVFAVHYAGRLETTLTGQDVLPAGAVRETVEARHTTQPDTTKLVIVREASGRRWIASEKLLVVAGLGPGHESTQFLLTPNDPRCTRRVQVSAEAANPRSQFREHREHRVTLSVHGRPFEQYAARVPAWFVD